MSEAAATEEKTDSDFSAEWAAAAEDTGDDAPPAASGERILNQDEIDSLLGFASGDEDGARTGMDLDLIRSVAHALSVPLVALGGAGDSTHLAEALRAGASAVASGSAFVFIGRLRAVLVSYPSPAQMDALAAQTP